MRSFGPRVTPFRPGRISRRYSNLTRGDLLFWKDHVAIVRDGDIIIHANAFHMRSPSSQPPTPSRGFAKPNAN